MTTGVDRLFAAPQIRHREAANGVVHLTSAEPLGAYPATMIDHLHHWAAVEPDRLLVAERRLDGSWSRCTYGQAQTVSARVAAMLQARGLDAAHPLLILSANSVAHLLMTLGAQRAGVPAAPTSTAYALASRDHARLRTIARTLQPGAVFADDAARFGPALAALADIPAVTSTSGAGNFGLEPLLSAAPTADASIGPDTVAKVLFTSGSTGAPKGVLTTHRMLTSNQQMIRQVWPFLAGEPPVVVDWLPWSHTFGGNHNVGLVLANGGALYIDEGRPAPGLFDHTLANLAEVGPTILFNVPAGYAQLVPALEADRLLAERVFANLRIAFNAAAALPAALRDRLTRLAAEVTGREIAVTGSWGTTETAPAATSAHYPFTDARCIGVPLPGVEIALVPDTDGSYEIRVRGPHVTPGYLAEPEQTAKAFDADGFYCPGDAVSFTEPGRPAAGLLFRGRLAEDFKLSTGTFVHVGALRAALLSAAPIVADAVITGENRDEVGALLWLNPAEVAKLGRLDVDGPVIVDGQVRAALLPALRALNATAGSSGRIARVIVMSRPADLDRAEITDKGYVNQRQVLINRADLVDELYRQPWSSGVIVAVDPPA